MAGNPIITLGSAAQAAACDAVVDLLDGAGTPDIRILQGVTPLVVIQLATPEAFGDADASGVATMNLDSGQDPESNAIATGTADVYEARNGVASVIWSGSVGTIGSGEALELSSTSITNGIAVRLDAANSTVTQPA